MYARIQKAIDSALLNRALCHIVSPSTPADIAQAEVRLARDIAENHKALLLEWGGSGLDEIRILSANTLAILKNLLAFANDYNGYTFAYNDEEMVFALDSDGGEITQVASNVFEFINSVFLGPKGVNFYGEAWVRDLAAHGLV